MYSEIKRFLLQPSPIGVRRNLVLFHPELLRRNVSIKCNTRKGRRFILNIYSPPKGCDASDINEEKGAMCGVRKSVRGIVINYWLHVTLCAVSTMNVVTSGMLLCVPIGKMGIANSFKTNELWSITFGLIYSWIRALG